MKFYALNASPRKNGSTARLLSSAVAGAEAAGASAQLLHLADCDYSGCISCYRCKTPYPKSTGQCVLNDDITNFLRDIDEETVFVIGSPVYAHDTTGLARNLIERLIFPYHTSGFQRDMFFFRAPVSTGVILTMSTVQEKMAERGYDVLAANLQRTLANTYGACSVLPVCDTYHFVDYDKVYMADGVAERKTKRFEQEFPHEQERAKAWAQSLVEKQAALLADA